ncbi:hypothetical protein [Streptomyces hydrogenans]
MTELDESEGHCRCCSKRDRPKRAVQWLGFLVRVVYETAPFWWPW